MKGFYNLIFQISKYFIMKKITLLLLSLILLNSCAEKVSSENQAKRAPGYLKTDGKMKKPDFYEKAGYSEYYYPDEPEYEDIEPEIE